MESLVPHRKLLGVFHIRPCSRCAQDALLTELRSMAGLWFAPPENTLVYPLWIKSTPLCGSGAFVFIPDDLNSEPVTTEIEVGWAEVSNDVPTTSFVCEYSEVKDES